MEPTRETVAEFLSESNKIEREYSALALIDAWEAWKYAIARSKLGKRRILHIHRLLMKHLWSEIAGKMRRVNVMIAGKKDRLPDHRDVPRLFSRLLDNGPAPDEESIRQWHVAFERIHPFRDGNGRVGRIIMNWQRVKAGLPVLVIHEGHEQQDYYRWFR